VIFEILGQTSNPRAIQPHLPSIFDKLVHLDFNQYRFNKVLGFRLNEGEAVQITNPFLAHGNAEVSRDDLCAANASSQLTCPHLTEINGCRRNHRHTFSFWR
jgi:hypothetical protein